MTTTSVDVLVIGAGPAGLSAAAAAAECGKRVLIVDQGLRPGGQVWRHRERTDLSRTPTRLLQRLRSLGATILPAARVIDAEPPGLVLVERGGRAARYRTGALVIATGARERFIPFPGWTLPGVVGVGGLQALIKSGLDVRGARVVVAGTGPLLFPVAATVAKSGATLLAIAEQASRRAVTGFGTAVVRAKPGALVDAARYAWAIRRTGLTTDCWIVRAEGDERLRRVTLSQRGIERTVECDWLATGAGLVPCTEIAELLGCAVERGAIAVDARQATSVPGIWAAGECTGVKGDAAAIVEGEIAGTAAGGDAPAAQPARLQRRRRQGIALGHRLSTAFALRPELLQLAEPDTVICRCEGVRRNELDPGWTQRQAKLWTRIGMGECQGAVCGPACAALFGWTANQVRPPLGAPRCGDWAAVLGDTTTGMESDD